MGETDDLTCFVLTSAAPAGTEIRQHTDGLVDFVLEPSLSELGYRIVRMDSLAEPGKVSNEVVRFLRSAELVIADLSFGDATVMYALGVRHTFGKPAIHVHTPSSVFPFDVSGLSGVVIDLADMTSVKQARKELARRVEQLAHASTPDPVHSTVELDLVRERAEESNDTAAAMINGLKSIEQRLAVMESLLAEPTAEPATGPIRSRRVFVVHGHDDGLKHQLARMLSELEFEVVILQEVADSGRTLLDKLRSEIDDIGFVFVLFTADDTGASKIEPDVIADRPRQNVVYEHGLFSGLLEPSRVCAIQRGEMELPSDLYGLVVKRIPDGAGLEAIQFDLLQELVRAGYDVDANQLMR
jgi:predicted nucleotide-binding protein